MGILERIGARNDLARAMVARAALRRNAGDPTRPGDSRQAAEIFRALGTLDEPARVDAARVTLDRGSSTGLSGNRPDAGM